jgi:hypothetical protein
MSQFNERPHPAIVCRGEQTPVSGCYLHLSASGVPRWTDDPEEATAFESMREAARAATRLPAALRAYGVPLQAELLVRRELH